MTALHDDGTIGVQDVDLSVARGELVLLLGQVGAGKSSLLSALAGLMEHTGRIRWNGADVVDAQTFLRPGQVAHVAQVPRVLSGTFADNVRLGHERDVHGPVAAARLERDVVEAGGHEALVGHRGVRLSGGQVQRLALARALATDAELLLADDVSSALDAATEIELWSRCASGDHGRRLDLQAGRARAGGPRRRARRGPGRRRRAVGRARLALGSPGGLSAAPSRTRGRPRQVFLSGTAPGSSRPGRVGSGVGGSLAEPCCNFLQPVQFGSAVR